jgi:hypothetical protein
LGADSRATSAQLLDPSIKRRPLNELHGIVRRACGLTYVKNGHDIRVMQLGG